MLLIIFYIFHSIIVPSMQVKLVRKQIIEHIPSASGIEVADGKIYIIGDDSAVLYILDQNWKPAGQIPLFDTDQTGRIPKKLKPDLESMTLVNNRGKRQLLILGSGSSEVRETGYLVDIDAPHTVRKLSLSAWYEQIRTLSDVRGDKHKLNLEGAAMAGDTLYFLQRGNISGRNAVISYPMQHFLNYLLGESDVLPVPQVRVYELPRIRDTAAGFSGAAGIEGTEKLIFTASVEDTADEINDGETLGSFVGMIEPGKAQDNAVCVLLYDGDTPYRGKVESVTLLSFDGKSHFTALAVTDNDGGASELLLIEGEL